MKKALIATAVLFAVLIVVLLSFFFIKTGNNSSSLPQSSLSEVIDGQNQPPVNITENTAADLATAFANAKQQNPDTVGWLKIEGTDIDNSILQSHDNNYYLRRTEAGLYDVYGCYFADYECNMSSRDDLSLNTVIYGHSDLQNNPDGLRFSQLFKFCDEQFAKDTPYIYISVQNEYTVWQVMAVFYTSTDMEYIYPNKSAEDIEKLVLEGMEKSLYNYNVSYTQGEKILCLSTCSVKYGGRPDERFVVMAKLLPADAELSAQADLQVNPSPRSDFE